MSKIPHYLFHPSTMVLILINIFTIFFAFLEQWNVYVILFLYVAQGLCIGFFHYFKILRLTNFDTTNFSTEFTMELNGNKLSVEGLSPSKAKQKAANWFMIGFLLFHLVYIVFITTFSWVTNNTTVFTSKGIFSNWFWLLIGGYFITHWISFTLSKSEASKSVFLGEFLSEPLGRIIPIHIAIIFGGFFIGTFAGEFMLRFIFLVLKTVLDVWLHISQHETYSPMRN